MATRRGAYRNANQRNANHCAVPGCKLDAPGNHSCEECRRNVHSVCMDEVFSAEGPPWFCGGDRCLATNARRKAQTPRSARAAAKHPQHLAGGGTQPAEDSPEMLPQSQQGRDAVDALVGLHHTLDGAGEVVNGCAAGQQCTKVGYPSPTTTTCCGRPCHGICAALCAKCDGSSLPASASPPDATPLGPAGTSAGHAAPPPLQTATDRVHHAEVGAQHGHRKQAVAARDGAQVSSGGEGSGAVQPPDVVDARVSSSPRIPAATTSTSQENTLNHAAGVAPEKTAGDSRVNTDDDASGASAFYDPPADGDHGDLSGASPTATVPADSLQTGQDAATSAGPTDTGIETNTQTTNTPQFDYNPGGHVHSGDSDMPAPTTSSLPGGASAAQLLRARKNRDAALRLRAQATTASSGRHEGDGAVALVKVVGPASPDVPVREEPSDDMGDTSPEKPHGKGKGRAAAVGNPYTTGGSSDGPGASPVDIGRRKSSRRASGHTAPGVKQSTPAPPATVIAKVDNAALHKAVEASVGQCFKMQLSGATLGIALGKAVKHKDFMTPLAQATKGILTTPSQKWSAEVEKKVSAAASAGVVKSVTHPTKLLDKVISSSTKQLDSMVSKQGRTTGKLESVAGQLGAAATRAEAALKTYEEGLGKQDAVTASPQMALLRSQIRHDVRQDFAIVVNEMERRFRDMTQGGLGCYFRDSLTSAVVSRLGNDDRIHASTPDIGSSTSAAGIGAHDKDEEVVRRALRSIAAKDADDRENVARMTKEKRPTASSPQDRDHTKRALQTGNAEKSSSEGPQMQDRRFGDGASVQQRSGGGAWTWQPTPTQPPPSMTDQALFFPPATQPPAFEGAQQQQQQPQQQQQQQHHHTHHNGQGISFFAPAGHGDVTSGGFFPAAPAPVAAPAGVAAPANAPTPGGGIFSPTMANNGSTPTNGFFPATYMR